METIPSTRIMEKAYEICLEMLFQRGYQIFEDDDDSKITARKEDGTNMCVFFADTPKFNVDRVKEFMDLMHSLDIKHCIIVYKDSLTPTAKKVMSSSDMVLELFTEEELQFNITKHRLVPKHEKLSEQEASAFKETFGNKFPTILRSDPISRFYGYSRGDVIKITRNGNSVGGGYITYRIVRG